MACRKCGGTQFLPAKVHDDQDCKEYGETELRRLAAARDGRARMTETIWSMFAVAADGADRVIERERRTTPPAVPPDALSEHSGASRGGSG